MKIIFKDIPSVKRDGEDVAREVSDATYHQGRMWIVDNEDHLILFSYQGGPVFATGSAAAK